MRGVRARVLWGMVMPAAAIIAATAVMFVGSKLIPTSVAPVSIRQSPLPSIAVGRRGGEEEKEKPYSSKSESLLSPHVAYVGPRDNIPDDTPLAYGFWSFSQPVPGVLSRSGQPRIEEFVWLKEHGWKSVVNLRVDGERGEIGDDMKLEGFPELGFVYLHLSIVDGHPPTEEQAEKFLAFVINPANQPVHVHCRGGIGRAGTVTALFRYAVQGWPMDKAIEESRAFRGGVSALQKKWLEQWAERHSPGDHRF